MRDPGLNTWTYYEPPAADSELSPPLPADALSNPTVEDLQPAGLACWPRGAAWGSPDGMAIDHNSVIARLTRAMLGPFAELYTRAWRIVLESTARTMDASLPEWEADYGLPDACTAADQTTEGRKQAVLGRVRGGASITPQDFIQLAVARGFDVAIEEPSVFECGFSECGGDHSTGDRLQEAYWIVHVYGLAIDYFLTSDSECGHDPLFQIADVARLQCLFRDLYPGWTQPVYVTHD